MDQSKVLLEKFRLGQTIEINGHFFQIHNFVPEMDFMNLKLLPKKDGLKKRTTPPIVKRLDDILVDFQNQFSQLLLQENTPEDWENLRKGSIQALANSLPMFLDIDGDKIQEILPDLVEDHFPKGECKERGAAIVLSAMIMQKILEIKPLKLKKT